MGGANRKEAQAKKSPQELIVQCLLTRKKDFMRDEVPVILTAISDQDWINSPKVAQKIMHTPLIIDRLQKQYLLFLKYYAEFLFNKDAHYHEDIKKSHNDESDGEDSEDDEINYDALRFNSRNEAYKIVRSILDSFVLERAFRKEYLQEKGEKYIQYPDDVRLELRYIKICARYCVYSFF